MSPSALLRGCSESGCPELVEEGKCAAHRRSFEQRRGSSAARGYGGTWRAFREWFRQHLIARGIAPVCGAALPDGPSMSESRCRQAGILNDQKLELDHDPPLRHEERRDRAAVEDPKRVGFLCQSCHAAKTARELAS